MWVCLKRMQPLSDPFRTEFCEECWRIYMQAYYIENDLFFGMTSRLACQADNIVRIEEFARIIDKWLEENE
ncbi:hypothetical protein KKD19_01420 [Patescibacteria group bacterium]|nr:hypothetical protein [Patescibacteria group bacterium]MBU4511892.1 hypothetical protein [Patescibacteria group bacterium]